MKEKFNRLGEWRIASEKKVIDTPWIGIKNRTYELPNGRLVEDYYIVEKPSVSVVIPLKRNQTYLIKEYERGVAQVGYKFPGGKIDAGENANEAAIRELKEELGIQARDMVALGIAHVDPGLMPTEAHYFLVNDFEEHPDEKVDDATELFEGEWVDLSYVGNKIATNEIKNSFVIIGYTLALNYLTSQK